MKRYAEIEFDQLDEDEWRPLCEKMDALVMKHFGILVESYDANWDNPCWLLCEAMDTYETTKNRSYPSLSKTRGYLEKVKKISYELYSSGISYKYFDNENKDSPREFADYKDAFFCACRAWEKKNKKKLPNSIRFFFEDSLITYIEILDIALNEVLPPKPSKGEGHDEYPAAYSSPDIHLVRYLIAFYHALKTGEDTRVMDPLPDIEDVLDFGTPTDPGKFFFFVQDVWNTFDIPTSRSPELLYKKIKDVIGKVKLGK